MVKVRNRVETLIQKLKSRFLLLDSDQKGCVRMHDLVRDVGLHIASEEFVEKINVGEKSIVVRDKARTVEFMDWPQNISTEETSYCTSLGINGHCQLFWLTTESPLQPLNPPTSNTRMKELKVLAIICPRYWFSHTWLSLDSVLPSLAVLRNLQTLRLERCAINHYVSVIGELKTLVILSLRGSDIRDLADTFKNLSDLRLLDLSECNMLRRISPGVLPSLSRLEELYMPVFCLDSLRRGRNSEILADLLSLLPRLTTLQVALPAVDKVLASSHFNKLESFKIAIEDNVSFDCYRSRDAVNYLEVHLVDASATVGSGITSMIKKTEILYLEMRNLSEPQVLIVLDAVCSAAKMRSLGLLWCDAVECLCDTTRVNPTTPHDSSAIFPVLNSLEISYASRMKEIFHGELLPGSLKELRSLTLKNLPAVTYIWKTKSISEWGVLRNIIGLVKELYIIKCKSLEEIVAFEYDNEEVINFQSLAHLTLRVLPNFTGMTKNISKGTERRPEDSSLEKSKGTKRRQEKSNLIIQPHISSKVHFPVLKELNIGNVDLKEIWNDQLSAESFCELKSLTVECCDTLLHLVPTHMQNRLHKLERIEVRYCSSLKEIFEIERLIVGDEGEAVIWNDQLSAESFCELKSLTVEHCDNLLHLVPTHMQNRLHKLERINVKDCSSLKEIFEIRRLIVGDEGEAAGLTNSESGNQGSTQINKMVPFKQSHQTFQNLTAISIYLCESLSGTLFSHSVAKGLVKLQELEIQNCRKIEEIVAAAAEGEETEDENLFPQLCLLVLTDLPNLGSFSQGKYNFMWPLLEYVTICNCPNMKKFCLGSLSVSIPKLVNFFFEEESLWQEFMTVEAKSDRSD